MARFDKIIDLDHPAKVLVKPMSMTDRAKIFLPFAALTGYDESVKDAGTHREDSITLGVDGIEEIDEALQLIRTDLENGNTPIVEIEYYDAKISLYKTVATVTEKVTKIDEYDFVLKLESMSIQFSLIRKITII